MELIEQPLDKNIFLSKANFSLKIEEMVLTGMSYFDAVLAFADEADKDPDELVEFMTPVLVEKLKACAIESGLAKSQNNAIDDL